MKCDPEQALQLRDKYLAVEHGYHMSKKHWNSIYWEREPLTDQLVKGWIDESYSLVLNSLSQKLQAQINE